MNNEFFKKSGWVILGAIVIIAVIVVVAVAVHHRDANSNAVPVASSAAADTTVTAQTAPNSAAAPASSVSTSPSSGLTISQTPQIHFVSQSANASSNGTTISDGIFTLQFSVNAAGKDIYISQSCHTTASANGISFSLTNNGTATTDGLGNQSCLVTSVSNASMTKSSDRFVVSAYTLATFQIAVAVHPTQNGNYKINVNQVGYATTDTAGTSVISTENQLQTNSINL